MIMVGQVKFAILIIAVFISGALSALFAFSALEFNDRLKYEVAYLKGYTVVRQLLLEGKSEEANRVIDGLIDAHTHTIFEFGFFRSSSNAEQIDDVLCRVVKLRESKARSYGAGEHAELNDWLKEIDENLLEQTKNCKGE